MSKAFSLLLFHLIAYSLLFSPELSARAGKRLDLVRLGVPFTKADWELAAIYLALSGSNYEENGLRLELHYLGSSEQLISAVENGSIDIGLLGTTEIVRAFYLERQIVLIMQYLQESPYRIFYLPRSKPLLRAKEDLAGHTVAGRFAIADSYNLLNIFLAENNLRDKVYINTHLEYPLHSLREANLTAIIARNFEIIDMGMHYAEASSWAPLRNMNASGSAFFCNRAFLTEANKKLWHLFAHVTLKSMRQMLSNPELVPAEILLEFGREFSPEEIRERVSKILGLLRASLLGSYSFTELGNAKHADYKLTAAYLGQLGIIDDRMIDIQGLFARD